MGLPGRGVREKVGEAIEPQWTTPSTFRKRRQKTCQVHQKTLCHTHFFVRAKKANLDMSLLEVMAQIGLTLPAQTVRNYLHRAGLRGRRPA